jgi:hypothetical protein
MLAKFMDVFATSGWMMVVKTCELIGALLVMVPRTRNLGLLVLGPIIVNIIIVHCLLVGDYLAKDPLAIAAIILSLFLLFVERKAWLGLSAKNRTT